MQRPRFNFWKCPGIYPILDLATCEKSRLDPIELVSEWSKYRNLIPFYQIRVKNRSTEVVRQLFESLRSKFPEFPILLNDYWKEAIEWDAFGAHVGLEDYQSLSSKEKEILKNSGLFLGTSSHSWKDLQNLSESDWDYTGFGPIFATASKENPHPPLGVSVLSKIKEWNRLPVVLIGGIDNSNLRQVLSLGDYLIAMISGACDLGKFHESVRILESKD
ncbi:hypothetical protein CH373_10020 [Leptospira perolatii]|uniref:Thiamine phosphate synthase/TenI domain-containing protein n=1 Tax=Leptospira perolatii TaxID=2023191 RepID=A0A2M9ZMT4_9LEPT|nr:thiamine phosphate synthase [Leptospira perolatii]PJZ70110.1 hypothetical protein CH360_07765 [Leptospira perolatii]PJZ73299.1 hypothetical protein CH373_10020 [Leptospira perolatii]